MEWNALIMDYTTKTIQGLNSNVRANNYGTIKIHRAGG